jgi:hypothetical protein
VQPSKNRTTTVPRREKSSIGDPKKLFDKKVICTVRKTLVPAKQDMAPCLPKAQANNSIGIARKM